MVWAKLDDAILDNPKIAMAGAIGFAMHVAGITYCCRNVLTNSEDGFIPHSAARRLFDLQSLLSDVLSFCNGDLVVSNAASDTAFELFAPDAIKIADHLVACGLWEKRENGYKIHDYEKYNPTKAQVEELSKKKSEAGKRGAVGRWIAPQPMAAAIASAMARADMVPKQIDGRAMAKLCPDPDPDPLTNPEEIPPTPRRSPAAPGVKSSRGSRAPSSVDPEAVAWCSKNGLPPPTDPEVASFLDYWCAVAGSRGLKIDWTATYRNRPTKTIPRASLKDHRQPASPATAAWRQETLVPAGEVPDDFLSYEVAK